MDTIRSARPLLLAAVFVCGCSPVHDMEASRDAALAVAIARFEAIRMTDFEAAMEHDSTERYARTPRTAMREMLQNNHARLGELQTWEFTNWRVNPQIGTHPGTYVVLIARTTYSKVEAKETLTLIRRTGTGPFRILCSEIETPFVDAPETPFPMCD